MYEPIARLISGLTVAEPLAFENMMVFGVRSESEKQVDYVTLQEALDDRLIEISEKDEDGSVPELAVRNPSVHNILMIQGEGLVGAKQNRILNTSVFVGAHSHVTIPVSCVEQGRWSYTSRGFSKADSSHSRLRSMTCKFTTDSLRHDGSYHSDQHRAWGEVQRKLKRFHTSSETRAIHDLYRRHSCSLDGYVKAFDSHQDWHGMAVAINGEIAGVDVFHDPETMNEHYASLLRSYALDALESRRSCEAQYDVSAQDVTGILRGIASVASQEFRSPGLGRDIRFRDDTGIGSALVYEDALLHFAFFPMPDA